MAVKTIAWTTGSGNITLTYTGQGNGSISVSSSENDLFEDREQSFGIVTTAGSPEKALSILVRQKGKTYPAGKVFNFAYTGSVQQITLPKGTYKLQCWGAQGGTSYGSSSGAGSKGGYSEGVLTLTETTTLYVFVGGQGSRGSSTSLVNGGWNGGGASVGMSSYSSGETYGESYPACGGGATDISTVTSSMNYSSGRTNRSSASLLARCIVAGGGAGGSYRYTEEEETTTTSYDETLDYSSAHVSTVNSEVDLFFSYGGTFTQGTSFSVEGIPSEGWLHGTDTSSSSGVWVVLRYSDSTNMPYDSVYLQYTVYDSTTSTSTSSGYSNESQQGGGTSGKGQYPGSQTSAGSGGGFGYGANQATTNYRYCAGAGGGGWYGGGTGNSDSSTEYVNYSGGGSGFVNIASNASSRPSGYTGLQLDSGTTIAGNASHPSVNDGTEIGHSGNGYARITVIDRNIMEFGYTGAAEQITLPAGTYKLQCWGAEGGQGYSASYLGGAGGYSEGLLHLTEETKLYIYVGGKGTSYATSKLLAGGFNGGGNAYTSSSSYRAAAGGGGTDIRIGIDSLYARVIVAGGGGGAGTYSSSSSYRYKGGAGGGVTGSDTTGYNTTYYKGYGGTETAGGKNYRGSTLNSPSYGTLSGFGVGGGVTAASSTYKYISGGGGGWYGGGYVYRAAAGGGSGYVYTKDTASKYPNGCLLESKYYLSNASTTSGDNSFESVDGNTETGHKGNGFVRIKKI